jgi:hypothetical protein
MDKPTRKRWPRAQRFQLSAEGSAAEAAYREEIVASRSAPGRDSFDAARTAWAADRGIVPGDGLYLGELVRGPMTLDEITRAVDSCGASRGEVHEAVARLASAGMIEPVVPPAPPPPPPPVMRRW